MPCGKKYFRKFSLHYKKWLRFYLDYCSKYRRDARKNESPADFQQKLLQKGQTEMQRKQAEHAVCLYLDIDQSSMLNKPSASSPVSTLNKAEISKATVPVQYPATNRSPSSIVPLGPIPPNEGLKRSQVPTRVPLSAPVSSGNDQPITGASLHAHREKRYIKGGEESFGFLIFPSAVRTKVVCMKVKVFPDRVGQAKHKELPRNGATAKKSLPKNFFG